MAWLGILVVPFFVDKYQKPQETQSKLLSKLIKRNRDSKFGQKHNFSSIKNYDEFKANVPLMDYEDLRPYIEEDLYHDGNALNKEKAVMYAQTSGTTGKPKYIPILWRNIYHYHLHQNISSYMQYKQIPGIFSGKILGIVSPAVEGYFDNGKAYGSMSGLIYKSLPWMLRLQYVVPYKVFGITDYDEKYQQILQHAIDNPKISFMASANPSTFMKIQNTCNSFTETWPNLKAIMTWTGGNCSNLIPHLKAAAPGVRIIEMGYISSEFRGSINIDPTNNLCALTIDENFYEFIEVSEYENDEYQIKQAYELEEGKDYYIIVTTQNGLYRYFINDIITVTGKFKQTPCIRFLQKGKGCTNITGEKLTENQVITTINTLHDKYQCTIDFYILIAKPEDGYYELYYQSNSDPAPYFETELSKLNIEFDAKRKSGRLQETKFTKLKKGTDEAYKQFCLNQGQREGQFKYIKLQEVKDCKFIFEEHLYEN